MAKISKQKIQNAEDNILHKGSFFEKEAHELGMEVGDLKNAIASLHDGGRKSDTFKAVCQNSKIASARVSEEELKRLSIPAKTTARRSKTAAVSHPTAPVAPATPAVMTEAIEANAPSQNPAETNVQSVPTDMIEHLLKKKESLESEFSEAEQALATANEMLKIREEALAKAKALLEKAQAAVNKATHEQKLAQNAVVQAEIDAEDVRLALEKIECEVQKYKNKIYLVCPWFTGELPAYGTFISTVDRDRCVKQLVPDEYLPEMDVDGILLFDYVPDYKKARTFIGLVNMFELEEKPYTLLVTDTRVQKLIEMNA